MTVSENIGHTLGLLTAVVTAAAAGSASPGIMLFLGSASALLAAVTMAFVLRKEKNHEDH